jgi:gliding motility-associated-like protein
VTIVNVLVPTAFSPNGDGINDVFRLIISNPAVVQVELMVYNRYGQQVFRSANVKRGWDGTFGGIPADIGTYFWKISYSIARQNFTEKGDLSLIR